MKKHWGASLIVAGICIGSGMLALPMVLSKIGLLPSLFLMIVTWALMYYTALVSLELNLQAGQGLSLGALGKHFSGPKAAFLGNTSLKVLSYALLAVFLDGGASVLNKVVSSGESSSFSWFSQTLSFNVFHLYAALSFCFFLLPIRWLDYINRLLFLGLVGIIGILIVGLSLQCDWQNLPLIGSKLGSLSAWCHVIPVVFASFGFHVIFHTLTDYCHKDAVLLKKAFFWGSLIPALVYGLWTMGVLGATYQTAPEFYNKMVYSGAQVGDLVAVLSRQASGDLAQKMVGWLSTLAILTSVLGVGKGLCDTWQNLLKNTLTHSLLRRFVSAILTILPAYGVALLVPNAFITVLGFAGFILVFIAILLPLFLLKKVTDGSSFFYHVLQNNWGRLVCLLIGIGILICEIKNLWGI